MSAATTPDGRAGASGTAHEYARLRDARGHRLCIHCQQAEPDNEPETDDAAPTMKGSTTDER